MISVDEIRVIGTPLFFLVKFHVSPPLMVKLFFFPWSDQLNPKICWFWHPQDVGKVPCFGPVKFPIRSHDVRKRLRSSRTQHRSRSGALISHGLGRLDRIPHSTLFNPITSYMYPFLWLVGGLEHFLIFPNSWVEDPIWLIFSRGVAIPPISFCLQISIEMD